MLTGEQTPYNEEGRDPDEEQENVHQVQEEGREELHERPLAATRRETLPHVRLPQPEPGDARAHGLGLLRAGGHGLHGPADGPAPAPPEHGRRVPAQPQPAQSGRGRGRGRVFLRAEPLQQPQSPQPR